MSIKKLVYGVGLNDVHGGSGPHGRDPIYVAWHGMMMRCYSPKYISRYPAYMGCAVFEGWHRFSGFRAWMLTHSWQGMVLDKDLLVPGNKLYGPETCVFIPAWLNNFLSNLVPKNRDLPMGVATTGHRYTARYSCREKPVTIGHFDSPDQAHAAYRRYRLSEMRHRIARYLEDYEADSKISAALCLLYEREAAEVDLLPCYQAQITKNRDRLNREQVLAIKRALESRSATQYSLAKKYQVGKSTIRDIAIGRTWKAA
jgi:hypothetical protein